MPIAVSPEAADELGHVNNTVYLQYVEAIARKHAEVMGLGWSVLEKMQRAFVVRRHELEYYRPAMPGDQLVAQTRIAEIKGPRAVRHVRLLRNGEPILDAYSTWIWIDLKSMVPVRIPKEIHALWAKASAALHPER